MKRIKLFKITLICSLAFPLLFIFFAVVIVVVIEMLHFEKYMPMISEQIEQARYTYSYPSKNVIRLLDSHEICEKIELMVTYQFLFENGINRERIISWHLDSYAWFQLLRIQVNEKDRLPLYLHFTQFGKVKGIKNASIYYFNKNYSELSMEELVWLYVISMYPPYYKNKEYDKIEERVKHHMRVFWEEFETDKNP